MPLPQTTHETVPLWGGFWADCVCSSTRYPPTLVTLGILWRRLIVDIFSTSQSHLSAERIAYTHGGAETDSLRLVVLHIVIELVLPIDTLTSDFTTSVPK